MTEISFTDEAIEDLRRIGPDAVPRVLKKILILETNPHAGHPLGGELTGFRKLVVGRNTWRVVYRVAGGAVEVCEIWAVGARRDSEVYAEATARVLAVAEKLPELARLADVIDSLGRLAGKVRATTPPREPVPDWLARRLVHAAGLRQEQVAAMDAEEAFEAWNAFITTPQQP